VRRASSAFKHSSKVARSRPPISHYHGPWVHLETRLIVASKLISTHTIMVSKFAWARPPTASPNSIHYGRQIRTIMTSQRIYQLARSRPQSLSVSSLHHGLPVYLRTRLITTSECISNLSPVYPPSLRDYCLKVNPQTCSITAFKFAQSWPPDKSHILASSRSLSALRKTLDHRLRVYLWVHSIIIFRYHSNCSQAPSAACPDTVCLDG
jgi:hypothetical protein